MVNHRPQNHGEASPPAKRGALYVDWRNIPIALIDTVVGEQTAQSCENADYNSHLSAFTENLHIRSVQTIFGVR